MALCEIELPRVGAETDRAVARAALVDAPLSDGARRRIVALHREMMPSAVSLMTELRHPDPALAAALVQG